MYPKLARIALTLFACSLPGAAAAPAELLAGIRQKMAANLAHLPDYTCRQTIERSRRAPDSKRFIFADRLRLEVSYVSGKELFAWPGAEKFEEKALQEMVPGGAVGTGSFALHARAIFASDAATFEYKGEVQEKGRRLARWDYRVPREKSKYVVSSSPEAAAIVGYHGSFWADAATLDLVRLEVETIDIPERVLISRGGEKVEYTRARIGASDFLLPRTSDLFLLYPNGEEKRNHVSFEACRQYTGESVVKFGDPDTQPAASAKPAAPLPPLPAGLDVEVVVKSRVDALNSAIGDPVAATLLRAVKKGDQVLAPKDTVLRGRISRIERRAGSPASSYVVGILFDRIEYGNRRGPFRARLESAAVPGSRRYAALPWTAGDLPGEGLFAILGGFTPELSPVVSNLRMVWRTD